MDLSWGMQECPNTCLAEIINIDQIILWKEIISSL